MHTSIQAGSSRLHGSTCGRKSAQAGLGLQATSDDDRRRDGWRSRERIHNLGPGRPSTQVKRGRGSDGAIRPQAFCKRDLIVLIHSLMRLSNRACCATVPWRATYVLTRLHNRLFVSAWWEEEGKALRRRVALVFETAGGVGLDSLVPPPA